MAVAYKEVDPINTECVSNHPDAKWKCMFAAYLVFTIKSPLFFM